MRKISSLSLILAAMSVSAGVSNLRCDYLTNPIGIDNATPRLSWQFTNETSPAECIVEIDKNPSFRSPSKYKAGNAWGCVVRVDSVPHQRYYWRVVSTDAKGRRSTSPVASFETGKFAKRDWTARWISDGKPKEFEPAPVFRHEFTLSGKPRDARAYVSALGYADVYINGKRVSDHHMDPGFTAYDKRRLYVAHDVTDYLRKGDNEIVVVVGNGFANCQMVDAWGQQNAPWRGRAELLCEIIADGKVVEATGKDWQSSTGAMVYNNIYSGEHYDARKGTDEWTSVIVCQEPSADIVAQSMPAIKPVDVLPAKLLQSWGDTVHVFDLGKNIAGVCRVDIKGEPGTKVQLAHGELLKKNGRLEQGNLDIYYRPLKSDENFQTDVYTLSGRKGGESYQPQFTYHGFRYVEVRSDKPVKASDISLKGLQMRTAIDRKGHFSCSNPLLNSIYDATMLSYEGNMHSIPTDCPQREKNGWTADAHVSVDLGLLNYDGITFYEKWMNDFIDSQRPNGNIPGIIPSAGWGYGEWPGPVWDSALFIIPLALHNYYGDDTAIKRLYPTMLKYFEWLKALENEEGVITCGIGDWLPYNTQTPTDFTSTLYAYADYMMMAQIAEIMGENPTPWLEYAEVLKKRINSKWFDAEKNLYANGSQASQGIALYWDIVPEGHAQAVAANLDKMIRDNNYALDFGLLGSKSVLRMLTRYGFTDTAYKMASRTEAPSWGNWIVEQGYTTLPETWTLSPQFRDASINHAFFGDISAWMTSDVAGINFDPSMPGFENVLIRPHFIDGLDWAEAEYNSVRGKIKSRWERKSNGDIKLIVDIPAATTATVEVDGKKQQLKAGKHTLAF